MSIIEQSRTNAANAAAAKELAARKQQAEKQVDMEGLARYVADFKEQEARAREMNAVAAERARQASFGGMEPNPVSPFARPSTMDPRVANDYVNGISNAPVQYPSDGDTQMRLREFDKMYGGTR
jgi:hypothetical protein